MTKRLNHPAVDLKRCAGSDHLRRQLPLGNIRYAVPESINVDHTRIDGFIPQRSWSQRRQPYWVPDELAHLLRFYSQRNRCRDWSENVSAVKSRTHRPEKH